MSSPALIVGCGYLGRRVALRWRAAGRTVFALTRNRPEELAAAGLAPLVGDVLDPASLKQLPAVSTVLYAVGFDRNARVPMREVYVRGLGNVIAALSATQTETPRFLHVSSTSVYGQIDGEWVNETSATDPREESGRIVLDAERSLRDALPSALVLRFAGIYGPDRLLRKLPLLKGEPLVGDAEKWLNLVHVDDGADAVLAAEARGQAGETYNIADGSPVSRREFYTHLAELLKAPMARFEPPAKPVVEPNRRVNARKARAELGFLARLPSYREGLAGSVL